MAEFLVIRLGDNPGQSAEWIAVDDNGTRRSPPVAGPLADAVKDVGERSVIVLVPAATVLTTSVYVPVKGGARLRATLPFALEDSLADDIDTLHFAAGRRRDSGRLPVSVVARTQMTEWLDLLETAGIVAAKIVPENHGLARIPGTLSLLVSEDQLMFNDVWSHRHDNRVGDLVEPDALDNGAGQPTRAFPYPVRLHPVLLPMISSR